MKRIFSQDLPDGFKKYLSLDILFAQEVDNSIMRQTLNQTLVKSEIYRDKNYFVTYPPFNFSRTILKVPTLTKS